MTTVQRLFVVLTATCALVAAGSGTAASDGATAVNERVVGPLSFAAGASTSPVPGFTTPRRLAFAAALLPNGSAIGHVFVTNPRVGDSHASLNCFIRQGNQAILGGVITQSSDPAAVGLGVAFAVQDGPDAISFFLNNGPGFIPQLTCANLLEQTGEPTITSFLTNWSPPLAQQWVSLGP